MKHTIHAALGALTLAACASMGGAGRSGDCEEIPWERPELGAQVVELQSAEGVLRFRVANTGRVCRDGGDRLDVGLADERGEILIHPLYGPHARAYWRIVPLTPRLALVDPAHTRTGIRLAYDIGQGERPGPLAAEPTSTPVGAAAIGAPARGTVVLERPGGQRLEFRQAWVEVFDRRIVVHAATPEGPDVAQMFTRDGEPLSPVVGDIEVWRTRRRDDRRHLLTATHPLRSTSFDIDTLYLPLDERGAPLPLPSGAVGVFPIVNVHDRGPLWVFRAATGWGIVFGGEGPPEVAIGAGPLDEVLKRTDLLRGIGFKPRTLCAESPSSLCANHFLQQRGGRWIPLDSAGVVRFPHALPFIPVGGSVEDPDAPIEEMRAWLALPHEERVRRRAAAQWTRVQADPAWLCDPRNHVGMFPREGVERYFRECLVSAYDIQALGRAVSPEALATAERRLADENRRLAEEERRRQEELAAAAAERAAIAAAWENGLRAMQAAAGASIDRALSLQHATYRRNLDAYNRGAQNWCCGGIAPP